MRSGLGMCGCFQSRSRTEGAQSPWASGTQSGRICWLAGIHWSRETKLDLVTSGCFLALGMCLIKSGIGGVVIGGLHPLLSAWEDGPHLWFLGSLERIHARCLTGKIHAVKLLCRVFCKPCPSLGELYVPSAHKVCSLGYWRPVTPHQTPQGHGGQAVTAVTHTKQVNPAPRRLHASDPILPPSRCPRAPQRQQALEPHSPGLNSHSASY